MATSRGPHTWNLTLQGGSRLGTDLPVFDAFPLGGPFALSGYPSTQPNTPAPQLVFSKSGMSDSHGMASVGNGTALWVMDRHADVAERPDHVVVGGSAERSVEPHALDVAELVELVEPASADHSENCFTSFCRHEAVL